MNIHIAGWVVLTAILFFSINSKSSKEYLPFIAIFGLGLFALVCWSLIMKRGDLETIILMEVKYRSSTYIMVTASLFSSFLFKYIFQLIKELKN